MHKMSIDFEASIFCFGIKVIIIDKHGHFEDLSVMHWQNVFDYFGSDSRDHIPILV